MAADIVIATRESPLALWQAYYVRDALRRLHTGIDVEILGMTSRGDQLLEVPLAKVGGKGLFVKELETALLDGRAHIAVHSMKDVPMAFPEGLELGIICEREEPADAFVSNRYERLEELPPGAVVGTSSLRRECQLRERRPDLEVTFLRGNVNSRLRKLDEGQYDAIILACAGLIRLEMGDRIRSRIPVEESLPAGGQGAVGVEMRREDARTRELLAPLHHGPTAERVRAERALNRHLQGGCEVPIASFAVHEGPDRLWLRGLVGRPDGSSTLRAEERGATADAEAIGVAVAEQLLAQGAAAILAEVYGR